MKQGTDSQNQIYQKLESWLEIIVARDFQSIIIESLQIIISKKAITERIDVFYQDFFHNSLSTYHMSKILKGVFCNFGLF